MDIQAAVGGNVEHCLWQDQAVGGDDHHVRLQVGQLLLRFGCFQCFGLEDRDLMVQRHLLDRAGLQFPATAGGAVRLGINANDGVAGGNQGFERGCREIRGASKNKSHGVVISVSL